MDTILVPLDGSPLSERALRLASTLAHDLGMNLRLLHVREPKGVSESEQDLELALRQDRPPAGARVTAITAH